MTGERLAKANQCFPCETTNSVSEYLICLDSLLQHNMIALKGALSFMCFATVRTRFPD